MHPLVIRQNPDHEPGCPSRAALVPMAIKDSVVHGPALPISAAEVFGPVNILDFLLPQRLPSGHHFQQCLFGSYAEPILSGPETRQ